jgi:annexin A7/11
VRCHLLFHLNHLKAQRIYDIGEGKWGTGENEFVKIFTSHTVDQMSEVMVSYQNNQGNSLELAVTNEFSGNIKIALLALLTNKVDFFCRRLKSAIEGSILGGTDTRTINRIIGGHDKAGAKAIADRYSACFSLYWIDVYLCVYIYPLSPFSSYIYFPFSMHDSIR